MTPIVHDPACPAEKIGQQPTFLFAVTPKPEGRMATVTVTEYCSLCPWKMVYVSETLPRWRMARGLRRSIWTWWITYSHRIGFWDAETTET